MMPLSFLFPPGPRTFRIRVSLVSLISCSASLPHAPPSPGPSEPSLAILVPNPRSNLVSTRKRRASLDLHCNSDSDYSGNVLRSPIRPWASEHRRRGERVVKRPVLLPRGEGRVSTWLISRCSVRSAVYHCPSGTVFAHTSWCILLHQALSPCTVLLGPYDIPT